MLLLLIAFVGHAEPVNAFYCKSETPAEKKARIESAFWLENQAHEIEKEVCDKKLSTLLNQTMKERERIFFNIMIKKNGKAREISPYGSTNHVVLCKKISKLLGKRRYVRVANPLIFETGFHVVISRLANKPVIEANLNRRALPLAMTDEEWLRH